MSDLAAGGRTVVMVRRMDPGTVALGMGVVGAIATVVVLVGPEHVLGPQSAAWHLVLETVDACIALLLAYLVYGRFRRANRLQDLLLLQGLGLLGLANVLLLLSLLQGDRSGVLDLWLPPSMRVLGTVLIAAAALLSDRLAVWPGWQRWVFAPVVVAVGLLVVGLRSQALGLPQPASPGGMPASTDGHPALRAAQVLTLICFTVAAVAFAVQARRRDDVLLRWLGPACALGALARLNYLLFPSSHPDWLYSGDVLRTGCYLLLLAGAGREISKYWSSRAQTAVAADRRRLARELHDGVLQELAYIRSEVAVFSKVDEPRVNRIRAASERAVDEARELVETLSRPGDEGLAPVLRRAVDQIAERHGVVLELDLDDSVAVDLAQSHALVRIAREAMLNAVRHGRAGRIRVQVGRSKAGCFLTVTDDGAGFDPVLRTQRRGEFGLVSMRERSEALPGTFELDSKPGRGTTLTVRW
ncbi:sensor histidine kinase [Kribbella qitaiheensis]|uniref:histidine kinase n=1 Tax=Kribbella qitaiheensis TaxID=1544730 RepID=A0A7G6WVJ8_9ACTN|nr:sensor histidine kinase [Kribbella qitaiheensis]QNE18013.1 sensor histidine kinase [Kribbella qitaiheensis]